MITQYNPALVDMTFGGVIVQGFADGDKITVEFLEERVTHTVGPDGDVVAVVNNNRMVTVTCLLQPGSPTNQRLSEIAAAQAATGRIPFQPLAIQDLNGTTLISIAQAWISQVPGVAYAKEAGDRTWTFQGQAEIYNVGSALVVT